jgi:hypothetical protein
VSLDRPGNVSELPQNSVYYQLLGDDTSKLKFQWAEQGGTVTADKDGNLNYFCYRVNPSLGYVPLDAAAAGGLGGEFLEITFPTDNGRDPIYVHYSQVYQPTDRARKEMDLLTIVLGVLYQNSRFSIAQLEDLLAEVDAINVRTAKLIKLYQLFNGMQSQFAPNETHTRAIEITWNQLSEFPKADLPLPFKFAVASALPKLFLAYRVGTSISIGPREGYWDVYCADTSFDPDDKSKTQRNKRKLESWDSGYYFAKVPDTYSDLDPQYKFDISYDHVYNVICEKSPYNPTSASFIKDCIAAGTDSSTVLFQDAPSDVNLEVYSLTPNRDMETGTIADFNLSKEEVNMEPWPAYDTAVVANGYVPILKTAEDIESGKCSIFIKCDDLKSYCDFIRSMGDSYSAKLSNVNSIISMANNDLQQSLAAASSLIQKAESAQRKTVSNVR